MKLVAIVGRVDPKTLGVEGFEQDAVSASVERHCDVGERVSTSAEPNSRSDEQDRVFLATLEKDSCVSNALRDTLVSAADIYFDKANEVPPPS